MFRKAAATLLAFGIILGTSASAFAYGPHPHPYPPYQPKKSHPIKKAVKYGAVGAGAGYILSGKEHRGTNTAKGAAIGAAASLFVGR